MDKAKRKSMYRWVRILHRDIGFFVIGLTAIYCISGIVLTYRDTQFLKSETRIEKTVDPGLSANQLGRVLHLRGIKVLEETGNEILFTAGSYNKDTGVASYVSAELPPFLRSFNGLHFVSSKDTRHWFTAMYASLLLFLALSSYWMYRPGSACFKRGLVVSGSGILASLVLLAI